MAIYHETDDRITRADLNDPRAEKSWRLVTPEDRELAARIQASPFYGYSAQRIAEWCLVSVETALRWKRFESMPSPQAMRLFELHRDRKVLGPEWSGWIVKGDRLVDPEDRETTQGQLRAYEQVYALCHELMRGDEAARARFERIVAGAA